MINNPFDTVEKAFRELYPDKKYIAYFVEGDILRKSKKCSGMTYFFNDSSVPEIEISSTHDLMYCVETLAHELAHVAVGVKHGHDKVFYKAFGEIKERYTRLDLET